MDVILIKDIDNLGHANDLITVKNGYARNYLLPKGYAIVANASNLKIREERIKQDKLREEKILSSLQEIVDQLKATVLQIPTKVGTTGKIFGSVTNHHIADAIKKVTGANIDRRKITLEEEIKSIGTYTAEVELHKDVKVRVSIEVIGE